MISCDSPMKLVIFQFAKRSYVQLPEGESLPYFIFHQNERCTKFLVGRYLGPQAEIMIDQLRCRKPMELVQLVQ